MLTNFVTNFGRRRFTSKRHVLICRKLEEIHQSAPCHYITTKYVEDIATAFNAQRTYQFLF